MPEIFTAYDDSNPEVVFIEIDGREILKKFESDIDLQIDLFEAGLSHSEIRTVMADINLSRERIRLGERHYMEGVPVFVGHPYTPPAPYVPPVRACRHTLEERVAWLKWSVAGLLVALAAVIWGRG